MANRLKDMVIDFVSLVPRGANQHADIVLAKRDDSELEEEQVYVGSEDVEKTDPSGDSVHVDKPLGSETKSKSKKKPVEEEDDMDEELDVEDDEEEEPAPERNMSKELGTTNDWSSSTLTHMADNTGLPEGLTPEAVAYIEKLEDLVLQKEDELTELLSIPDDVSKEDNVFENELDEIAKNDPTVAALIAKADAAEARAQEAENIAKAERETRITSEMIAKAQGYTHLGSVEDVASILKGLHDNDFELFEAVDGLFAKAESAIAEGSLFSEIGKTTESGIGADLESVAKSLRAEDPTLTAAQAVTKALELRPELYNGGN
jgi:hypothetical protein